MNLPRWIVKFLRKLLNNSSVRWTIRSILAIFSFLRRRTAKPAPSKKESSPTDETVVESFFLPLEPSRPSSAIICASLLPDTNSLRPYPFSRPNASNSSQDITTSSVHGDVNVQRSSRPLGRISPSNGSGDFAARGRSNPHIDLPTVSGFRTHLSGSVSRRSASRPNSFHDRPNLSVSRPISVYTGSQTSIPSITIDHGPEGLSKPMQTSPVQEEPLYPLPGSSSQESQELSKIYEKFRAIAPNEHARYEQEVHAPFEDTSHTIQPRTLVFHGEEIPIGWKKLLHPEGARYYVYQDKKYYTDANLIDNLAKERIMSCINDFEDFCRGQSIRLPDNSNTVFHLRQSDEDPAAYICDYYIANHETRSIFWLDTFESSWLPYWSMVKGVTSLTHVGHLINSQYWYHCHLFPHCYDLTAEIVDELRDILAHSICDVITSPSSTVPYSISDLNQMMQLCNELRTNPGTGGGVSAFSRIMCIFMQQRFLNHHDQLAVRLDRDQSVYFSDSDPRHHPWLLRCISPALFSAPYLYFRLLRKLWVDSLVHEASWADFVTKMNDEWQQIIFLNTILLNANVAFLAIQSIDNSSNKPGRSPAQIASFLSIIASFGSIIVGLVLTRKHRAKAKETAQEVAVFLNSWEKNRLGLATLAIIYSTPYAMLLWGVLCFLIAFSFMCYSNSDVLVRSLMSGAWFIIVILVLWCVTALAVWDSRIEERKIFWEWVHQVLSFLLFGLWWLIEGMITTISKCWKLIPSRSTQVQQPEQLRLRNTRKSSVGTVVIDLWRKSSLFSRTGDERKSSDETDATVGV
ncbi:hypothetical protein GYMLUDRAFT_35963 [Collybiopsis luxurians FD-317 M1]|nr:hypothetical protein GYMLUDRAFT_35963 [Collybiopsis luxurians FD-317 M1]